MTHPDPAKEGVNPHDIAQDIAHSVVECWAYTGEGREHSGKCKLLTALIVREILNERSPSRVREETIEECAMVVDMHAKTEPKSGPQARMIATIMSDSAAMIARTLRSLKSKGHGHAS